jgi:NDP-sugar pyrophosphorylase family protein
MRAGIIAAGEGSRLREGGLPTPKPLLRVGGMSLLERTLRGLEAAGVEEVALIVNEAMSDVARAARELPLGLKVHPVIRTTASSMHSLYHLRPHLDGERFVLCTVDSILPPAELVAFVEHFVAHPEVEVLLSYTDFVDDEKPLYIRLGADQRVAAIGQGAEDSPFVTVGLYGFSPEVFPILEEAVDQGLSRLRNFLELLLGKGFAVHGYRISKAIDVDRPHDIEVAEKFLTGLDEHRV